jgi:hypothetical protein
VTGAPEGADPATSDKAFLFADESRHCDHMVGVRGMLQAKHETQGQDRKE